MKHQFFLVVAPGLESLARNELETKVEMLRKHDMLPLSLSSIQEVPGGIELESDLLSGLSLNHFLKIPTRILLRLHSFKATDFGELFKKSQKIDWQRYLRAGEVNFKVSSVRSRLKIKSRLEETLRDALLSFQKKAPLRKPFLPVQATVFLRLIDDQAEISIDTSGEPLYKRGWQKHIGHAPVRETLASSMYYALWQRKKRAPSTLVDPMAGSGTLLWEASDFFLTNRRRRFAFQNFPAFKGIESSGWPESLLPESFELVAFDLSASAVEIFERNKSKRASRSSPSVQQNLRDVLSGLPLLTSEQRQGSSWLMVNPPYDMRLSADLKGISEALQNAVIKEGFEAAACLWPQQHWDLRPFKKSEFIKIKNGGIEVGLITYFK